VTKLLICICDVERIQGLVLFILTPRPFRKRVVYFQGITMSKVSRRWSITSSKYVVMFYDPARLIVLEKMPGGLQQEITQVGYLTTTGTM